MATSKWVATLDSSVLVPAAVFPAGDNANVVRAAVTGLFDCVLSEYIRAETREVLARPQFGLTQAQVDQRFEELWLRAWILDPVPSTNPHLLRAVKDDVKDLPVLATGIAIFSEPTLAPRPKKFLVSNNTTDFTPGWNVHGLEFITGPEFWRRLQEGAHAKVPPRKVLRSP